MKTKFRKVWCVECRTMQFQGECPHAQRVQRTATPAVAVSGIADSDKKLKMRGPWKGGGNLHVRTETPAKKAPLCPLCGCRTEERRQCPSRFHFENHRSLDKMCSSDG